jgi:hypothetical protein
LLSSIETPEAALALALLNPRLVLRLGLLRLRLFLAALKLPRISPPSLRCCGRLWFALWRRSTRLRARRFTTARESEAAVVIITPGITVVHTAIFYGSSAGAAAEIRVAVNRRTDSRGLIRKRFPRAFRHPVHEESAAAVRASRLAALAASWEADGPVRNTEAVAARNHGNIAGY